MPYIRNNHTSNCLLLFVILLNHRLRICSLPYMRNQKCLNAIIHDLMRSLMIAQVARYACNNCN